jgi:hypothetical protein
VGDRLRARVVEADTIKGNIRLGTLKDKEEMQDLYTPSMEENAELQAATWRKAHCVVPAVAGCVLLRFVGGVSRA